MKLIKKAALNKRRVIAIVIGILFLAFWLTWRGPLYWFYCYLINDIDIKPYFGNFTTEELLSADFDRAEVTWDLGTPTTTLTQQQAEELVEFLLKLNSSPFYGIPRAIIFIGVNGANK